MVSARFRAGETSAKLSWAGLTAVMRGQKPAAAIWLAAGSGVRVAAGHIIQGRSVLGQTGLLRSPSTALLRATRLHHCYTAGNRGRSAKPARSLLTKPFRLYTAAAS